MRAAAPRLTARLASVALGLGLGACAAAPSAPPPPLETPAAAPTASPAPSPLETLLSARREKAEALEQAGRLRQALDEWKIALTVSPSDPAAREGKRKLANRIEAEVSERMRQGREALGRGDNLEARRHFLAALALDPANRVAFETLRTEVKELRFVNHTVRRGETLATIAERYYRDRSRSEVIWEVNQLPPNPRLAAGTVLKIPEIPGVPFLPEARPSAPADVTAAPDASRAGGAREETPPQMNPLLVEAKEALDKGDYQVALVDVDKVLAGNAQSAEGVDLKKQALYGLGKSQLGQRRYDQSMQTLTQLARLAPDYQDVNSLLRQARERVIQEHYSQGLRFFQEEKLDEAIAQWRIVLDHDPQHANARRNIDQAERLLRSLRGRQQPPQPSPLKKP